MLRPLMQSDGKVTVALNCDEMPEVCETIRSDNGAKTFAADAAQMPVDVIPPEVLYHQTGRRWTCEANMNANFDADSQAAKHMEGQAGRQKDMQTQVDNGRQALGKPDGQKSRTAQGSFHMLILRR